MNSYINKTVVALACATGLTFGLIQNASASTLTHPPMQTVTSDHPHPNV